MGGRLHIPVWVTPPGQWSRLYASMTSWTAWTLLVRGAWVDVTSACWGKYAEGLWMGRGGPGALKVWLKLGRWAEWNEWFRGNGCTRTFLVRCQRRLLAGG